MTNSSSLRVILRAQDLAMRAIAANLCARENNLEPELRFDLALDRVQLFAEELLDAAATQANDVRMLALQAGFVVMLLTLEMR